MAKYQKKLKPRKRAIFLALGSILVIVVVTFSIGRYWIEIIEKYQEKQELENELLALKEKEDAIVIYELDYVKIAQYLRWMFNIHPKDEHAKGRATKEAIIDEERWNIEAEKKKKKDNDISKSFP